MATYTWNGVTGDWSVAADWTGGPPSPPPDSSSADVNISAPGSYRVTIATGESFAAGTVSVSDGSAVLSLDGTAALTVTGAFANSGTLYLDEGGADSGGGSLTIGGVLTNTKAVLVGNKSAATAVTLGGLTNASGASFTVYGSTSHAATLTFTGGAGSFTGNSGAVTLYDVAPLTLNTAFTNSGSFALQGTSALTVTGALGNSGTLDLDVSAGDGGGGLTIGGVLTNTGAVGFGNYALSAATPVKLGGLTNASGAHFSVYGSTSHAATLTFTGGAGSFTSNSGTVTLSDLAPLTLNAAFTNSGTFALDGTSALTVAGAFANSGTLYLDEGGADSGGGSLTIGGALTNTKAVLVGNKGAATAVTLGGLTNAGGASFTVYGSTSHAATLTFTGGAGSFTGNSGAVTLYDVAPLTLNTAFTNSGSFALQGTSALTVTGALGNSGTLDLDVSAGDGGGGLTIGGVLTNTGAVGFGNYALSAATPVKLGGLTNASGAHFSVYGSTSHAATLTFTGGAGSFTSNSGTVTLSDLAPLTLNAAFTNSGTFALDGTSALTVAGAFANSGTLYLDEGGADSGGGSLTIGGVLTNTKTVLVGNKGAATAVTLGGLTNAGGASFTLYGSSSHAATLAFTGGAGSFTGNMTNLSGGTLSGGTYEVNAGSTLQLPNNTPIVTDDADIILSGAGSTIEDYNTLTRSYDTIDATLLTIGASGQLHLLAGRNWTTADAAITNDGQLELGGGTLTATASGASLTNAAGATILGHGTINVATFTDQGTIEVSGGTLTLTGSSTLAGAISGAGGLTLGGGTVAINAGANLTEAKLTLSGAATAVTLNENLSYGGTFLQKANPTLSIASGDTLTLTGSSTLTGKISGAGGLTLGGGTTAINSVAKLTEAKLTLQGAGTAVTLNEGLTYAGTFSDGAGTQLTLNSPLTLTGASTLAGAIAGAGGLTLGGGSVAINSGATLTEAKLTLSGAATAVTLNENLSYGGTFLQKANPTLSIASGDTLTLNGIVDPDREDLRRGRPDARRGNDRDQQRGQADRGQADASRRGDRGHAERRAHVCGDLLGRRGNPIDAEQPADADGRVDPGRLNFRRGRPDARWGNCGDQQRGQSDRGRADAVGRGDRGHAEREPELRRDLRPERQPDAFDRLGRHADPDGLVDADREDLRRGRPDARRRSRRDQRRGQADRGQSDAVGLHDRGHAEREPELWRNLGHRERQRDRTRRRALGGDHQQRPVREDRGYGHERDRAGFHQRQECPRLVRDARLRRRGQRGRDGHDHRRGDARVRTQRCRPIRRPASPAAAGRSTSSTRRASSARSAGSRAATRSISTGPGRS